MHLPASFSKPVRTWFARTYPKGLTKVQSLAFPLIQGGHHTLILAPTGSGKTLAAFLAALDRLLFGPRRETNRGCQVVYVSPLKALAVDIERNLQVPLVGILEVAKELGIPANPLRIALRTGDTPQAERNRFIKDPAEILVTTPESLFLLLTTKARASLVSTRQVILDEIHALLPEKRGSHLALSVERLAALVNEEAGRTLQRIGLSATVDPPEVAGRFLGGFDKDGLPRKVEMADGRTLRKAETAIDMPAEVVGDSAWPKIHALLLKEIRSHRSTLIFVNSRRLAERLASSLNELSMAEIGHEIAKAHHGSISKEERSRIEESLKAGTLAAVVATSSLELGIDMGEIDRVVQIGPAASAQSAIQRIGRSGHNAHRTTCGLFVPKAAPDILPSVVLAELVKKGQVEPQRYQENPLDVLSQQIVAMVVHKSLSVEAVYHLVRQAAPFRTLPRESFDAVLDMLSGRYPSDEFAGLRPRLVWDRLDGVLHPRKEAARLVVLSGGTIPDRGLYGVYLAASLSDEEQETGSAKKKAKRKSTRVGELDEEMVFESRVGDTFVLGASTWRIEEITFDRVLVSPAPGEPGRMPFWRGESAARPLFLGRKIGELARIIQSLPRPKAKEFLERQNVSDTTQNVLFGYLDKQLEAAAVPDDRTLVAERYRDEIGDHRICLHSVFGGLVHAPWALLIRSLAKEKHDIELDVLYSDDGIVLRFPGGVQPPSLDLFFLEPEQITDVVSRALAGSTHFAARFREAAVRSLLLARKAPSQRNALWQQRRRSADLLAAAARYLSFPMVLEAYRECLKEDFDLQGLKEILEAVKNREIQVLTVDRQRPSPYAMSLTLSFAGNFLYEPDLPPAERRARALLVDPAQLRALLGEVEVAALLDPEVVARVVDALQRRNQESIARVSTKEDLHDLLRHLGDLSLGELHDRVEPTAKEQVTMWADELVRCGQAVWLTHPESGAWPEPRLVASEDASRYRDALGVTLPSLLPAAFLQAVTQPLSDLVRRYARTHGPFSIQEMAQRLGLAETMLTPLLQDLVQGGKVVVIGKDYCDAEVLRRLQKGSLIRLQKEIRPLPQEAFARFALRWHGISQTRRGSEALLSVLEQLGAGYGGIVLPASCLETEILPARMTYDPQDLDRLLSSGEVCFRGVSPLGERDGRLRLFFRQAQAASDDRRPEATTTPVSAQKQRIRDYLKARGASFFLDLKDALSAFQADLIAALWDLVWDSEVTNDTFAPVRGYLHKDRATSGRGSFGSRGGGFGFRQRIGSSLPKEVQGRWSLLPTVLEGGMSQTEHLANLCQRLLWVHGIVTREAVASLGEEIPEGFSSIYPVLKVMEEAGKIRRGYFIEGLSATQFALPEALTILREPPKEREPTQQTVVLAASDPANLYGAALPWPKAPEGARRPSRQAGAQVVLHNGVLIASLVHGTAGAQLTTFVPSPAEVAAALAERGRHSGRLFVREINGVPAPQSPLCDALLAGGFEKGAAGLSLDRDGA